MKNNRIETYQSKYDQNNAPLVDLLSQKNGDITQMKWKLNEALDLKSRFESENQGLLF